MGSDKEVSSQLFFQSVQSLSCVRLFATPWIAAHQASLSITNTQSLLKLMSIESVMPSSHLILCRPLLLLPPILPSIRVFSNESTLRIRWPKYWSFSSTWVLPINSQDWYHKIPDRILAHFLGPRFRPGVCWYTPPFHQHPRLRQWWSRLVALSFIGYMSRNWKGAYLPLWDVQGSRDNVLPILTSSWRAISRDWAWVPEVPGIWSN